MCDQYGADIFNGSHDHGNHGVNSNSISYSIGVSRYSASYIISQVTTDIEGFHLLNVYHVATVS